MLLWLMNLDFAGGGETSPEPPVITPAVTYPDFDVQLGQREAEKKKRKSLNALLLLMS